MNSKFEFLKQVKNTDITLKVIKDCRAHHLSSQGKEQRANFKAGGSAVSLFNHLVAELAETKTNQFTMPNTVLASVIGCDTTDLSSRMKTFFRQYGMGDFVSTGKSRYNIFKVVDANNKEIETKIKAESHYTFYFSTEALNLMEAAGILTDVLDYDKLRSEVAKSQNLLTQIANKKTVNVQITQYVNEYVSIETRISVEKDFLSKQGSFEKHSEVLVKDTNGTVTSTEIESINDTFVPKVEAEQQEEMTDDNSSEFSDVQEAVEELLSDFDDEEVEEEMTDEEKANIIEERIKSGEINNTNRIQFKEEIKFLDSVRGVNYSNILINQVKRQANNGNKKELKRSSRGNGFTGNGRPRKLEDQDNSNFSSITNVEPVKVQAEDIFEEVETESTISSFGFSGDLTKYGRKSARK